jgi:hypothetical protein
MVSVSVAGHGGRLAARHVDVFFGAGPRFRLALLRLICRKTGKRKAKSSVSS